MSLKWKTKRKTTTNCHLMSDLKLGMIHLET